MTIEKWNEVISDDIEGMKKMLDSINEKMKNHLSGEEKFRYIAPIKEMIFEAWSDLCENGKPTFE